MSPEQRAEIAARFHEAWFGDGLIDDIMGRMALQSTMQRLDRATAAGFSISLASVRDHTNCETCRRAVDDGLTCSNPFHFGVGESDGS